MGNWAVRQPASTEPCRHDDRERHQNKLEISTERLLADVAPLLPDFFITNALDIGFHWIGIAGEEFSFIVKALRSIIRHARADR